MLKTGDKVRIVGSAEEYDYGKLVFEVLCEPWTLGDGTAVAKIKCDETGKYFPSYSVKFLKTVPENNPCKSKATAKALSHLSEREHEILTRYYGLDGCPRETLAKIGERLGLSARQIARIRDKTDAKLKQEGIDIHADSNS